MPRPTVAEISLGALTHNWQEISRVLGSSKSKALVCAIVKADSYGHGAALIAPTLAQLGCENWGVHSVEEALAVRRAGVAGRIVVLGGIYPDEAQAVVEQNLTPAIYDHAHLRRLQKAFEKLKLPKPVAVHLKLDTGMGRIGVRPEMLADFIRAFQAQQVFHLAGAFAHLPQAEDGAFTKKQGAVFETCLQELASAGFTKLIRHHSNSLAAISDPALRYDLVRPGLILYGHYPHSSLESLLNLQPVMRFVSRIISIRDIPAGVGLSYGHTFTTKRASRIATIPVGYADGYPRLCSNQAEVLVRGKKAPIVGRVCMDMSLFDVTDIPEAAVDDRVVLFGREGEEEIPVERIAAIAQTIPYEILCGISPRVPRIGVA